MKQTYIRCPRCELNYILKKDKFCNVCKAEMKAVGNMGTDEDMDLELCPICKTNYINADEDICPACAKEREEEEDDVPTSVWDTYTSPDDDEGYNDEEDSDMVSITGLDDNPLDDDSLGLGLDDEDEQDEADDEESGPDELDEDFEDIGDDDGLDDDEEDDDEDDDF